MATVTTDVASGTHGDHDDHGPSTGISNTKLAMWLFLGSECLLFGGLISTYNAPGPVAGPKNFANLLMRRAS